MKRLDEQGRLEHYRELMEEARHRFDVLEAMLAPTSNFDAGVAREICYLQFRYICEVIALACLLAQGTFTKRLLDTYEADKIIYELHPYIYPQPCRVIRESGITRVIGLSDQPGYLTRDDLPELWGRCGEVLHLSPLKKTLKPKPDKTSSLSDVQEWFTKIKALLNEHLLVIIENKKMLVAHMYAPYFHGRPAVNLLNFEVTP